jgi:hypothetical protein
LRRSKDGSAPIQMRPLSFLRDQLVNGGTRSVSIEQSGLFIEPPERAQFLLPSELCRMNGGFQHAYRLVVDTQRHREWMPVLPSVRERKSSRVGEAIRGSMHDLGTVRAPTPGVSSSSGKSLGPRSAAAAKFAYSRFSTMSPGRTS